MKVRASVIDELLSPVSIYPKKNFTRKEVNENPPFRAELFSNEQMEQHAQQLATLHSTSFKHSAELLLKELADNEKTLYQVNKLLLEGVKEKKPISPAAEWLLDNFYLIDEQIRIAKRYLPKGYSKGLPKLKTGSLTGFPRVYSIAIEIISHSDGHIDIYRLKNFITAYQKESLLTLGELWAFPIMLRLALLENLSRVAARIAVDRKDSALANTWAKQMIDIAEKNPKDLVLVIADMARSKPPITSAFVAEFARKLQWKGMELVLPIHWVEQQLSGTEDSINAMILMENQTLAADQVSVSNSINSLRFLAKNNWRDFVEDTSAVEQLLRKDIHGIYESMDFHTRDYYRHIIEGIARNSGLSENKVAQLALDLAQKSHVQNPDDNRRAHVGYYLLGSGADQTEKIAEVKLTFLKSLKRSFKKISGSLYTFIAILITLLISGGITFFASQYLYNGWLIVIATLSLFSGSYFAFSFSNWVSTLWIKPIPLPKLNFSSGIPEEARTMVVVPTLLANPAQVEKLLEELEVRFLSNRDPNLLFALLTDFRDADYETMPDDEELLDRAQTKINLFNEQYDGSFLLFHRPRKWNPVDKIWMGYERKRGKLSDLNHVLRGHSKESFSAIIGDEKVYTTVKYIITLDTDTQLPREAAWKLVGLMAHPLNQPVFDENKKRVVEGYAIIQPRLAISLHGATRSGFTQLHENDSGIDPYTRVTSDVYQDLFGEGSFIGKGIYEIDAFEKALNNRFPENRILSHDLLEGTYARAGFASDIQFYEDYPTRYQTDSMRRHRWIRGDWQIGNWFLPIVPGNNSRHIKNTLSSLSRWKIFDNLRRSLIPIANFSLLILGWTVLPFPWFWTLTITGILLVPAVLLSLWSGARKPKEIGISQHINNTVGLTSKSFLQSLYTLMCLPYEALISLDAIGRTLWRINISRKNLLKWNPSGLNQNRNAGILNTYRSLIIISIFAAGFAIFLFAIGYITQLYSAASFLLLWIVAPAIVAHLDRPITIIKTRLTDHQKNYLRELARKTWSFFETLIGAEDHWLPPDNLQQYPIPVVAHRTSPTNIGLSLLANLTAHDFGYATTSQLIERTGATFSTLQKMERYQGHFYNWYDTQTLQVLNPRYISTVDSGNFAGHMLTLRQGLLTIPKQKIIDKKIIRGLQDTLRLTIQDIPTGKDDLKKKIYALHDEMDTWSYNLPELKDRLERLLSRYKELTLPLSISESRWVNAFELDVNSILKEIMQLAPWLNNLPIPEKFNHLSILNAFDSLEIFTHNIIDVKPELLRLRQTENTATETTWLNQFEKSLDEANDFAHKQIDDLKELAHQAIALADMEYGFLYDKSQSLLSIGYDESNHHRDISYYDLLASEARLSSFVAIAQGKIPQESWFALGRRLTRSGNTPVLLSWSGSMFEYLMPGLVMPTYKNTLLDVMCIGSVGRQIEYGEQQGIPWGISESCYNLVDAHLTYQYRAFGVPGLGFKRGLGQDLVVAPYATILALMVNPLRAYQNLETMKKKGFEGQYGFYEAIDYTPVRLARDQRYAIIRTFMTHHQGMSLLSLAYLLLDQPMQKRFEADTQFQTALLLLQEQVPRSIGFYSGSSDHEASPVATTAEVRVITTANTPIPEVQLLSNGHYFVMLTNAGGGYSRWRDFAVTRWHEDATCDNAGMFCYIHDLADNEFWSTAYQPTLKKPTRYEAIFSQGKVEYRRRDNDIETYTTIIVSPEDDAEVRRIELTNRSSVKKELSITSYAEVVLAPPSADHSHPAFSNLFIQTEIHAHSDAIVCTRRPRSAQENPPWMFHMMKLNGVAVKQVSYETDRSKFIGRGNTLEHPQIMNRAQPLSGSQGSVLDPIVSIQYKVILQPGESATIDIVNGIAESRQQNHNMLNKYQDKHLRDRAFELSWTHSQVVLRQIGATKAEAELYAKMASSILYINPTLRTSPGTILKNQRQQTSLWSYSISGDLPIVLLIVSDPKNIQLVKQLIKAKVYWQMKGLAVDLVILNEDPGGYRQELQDEILGLIAAGTDVISEKQGRIFVRPVDQVSTEDRILFQTVAQIVISDKKGSLVDQLNENITLKSSVSKLIPSTVTSSKIQADIFHEDLQYFNGSGGFSADGKHYVIKTYKEKRTPMPWINVLANPNFGTIISECGSSYTWFENAHEFRLTPWKNDPILDNCGEAFYIRDEESGHFWSPMGLPTVGNGAYITKHGFGQSNFQHQEVEIFTNVTVHVDAIHSIKFVTISIKNQSHHVRKLTATGYVEWVLSELRAKSVKHITIELDTTSRALIARNRYSPDFQNYVTFFQVDNSGFTYTGDRTEFIGRNRNLQNPEAMQNAHLSGKVGAGLDACAALMVPFTLEPGQERKIIFKLGAGKNLHEVQETIKQFNGSESAVTSLDDVTRFWNTTLGAVQVETPDASINILANGWLLYQVLSCRLWGRSGFYQSGGAFGFRDQLQDVLALVHAQPNLTRQQILLCASRQFKEGDVQHWWHPPTGRGVRTMCSDDYLWLPFVTSRYIDSTRDDKILNEIVPYIEGRKLNVGEESYYDMPIDSEKQSSVYGHCKQSILHGLRFGKHGLPLMGSGDWNDGMNMVGIEKKGESVWLAFFLYDVLIRFTKVAELQDDFDFVTKCEKQALLLKENIKKHAWDGDWYLRAFFDDGTPLGSNKNEECKIDAISQSWSILSGCAEPDKALAAMNSANRYLINRDKKIIQLLEPPFNNSDLDPGYIKGYVPGVRENGGQYSHAAIWMIMAFAKLGDHEKTAELLKMINPIHHATTPEAVAVYKTEPYVMAADVYAVMPHTGRGGWTWYTGSAGWMYQLILESFLGLKREGDILRFEPCVPKDWKSFSVTYRFLETVYNIELQRADKTAYVVDGVEQKENSIPLVNDRKSHAVIIFWGTSEDTHTDNLGSKHTTDVENLSSES